MKTKTDILSRLQELVAEVEAEQLEKERYATGDMVTFADGEQQRVGLIESFDQDDYTVRVHAPNEDGDLEPTDEVFTVPIEQLSPYPPEEGATDEGSEDAEAEEGSEDADTEQPDQEEDKEEQVKVNSFVKLHTKRGVTYAKVISMDAGTCLLEVYVKTTEGYEPTAVEVSHNPSDLTACGELMVKKNPNKILAKFNELKMEIDDNVGIIEGYASTFGNVDLGGDRVMKGAFTQTFSHKSTRKVFFDHYYGTNDIAGVGTFTIDDNGLKMRAELPLDATDVKDSFVKIKFLLDRNEDMGLSIGYNTIKSRMSPEGIRDLLELAVMETSITPFPMNTDALIMSAKSRKIQYQAKRQAWQTIVPQNTTDAPIGNQLTQDDIMSLVGDIKTIIHKPISQ